MDRSISAIYGPLVKTTLRIEQARTHVIMIRRHALFKGPPSKRAGGLLQCQV